jgi:hypothetical protein
MRAMVLAPDGQLERLGKLLIMHAAGNAIGKTGGRKGMRKSQECPVLGPTRPRSSVRFRPRSGLLRAAPSPAAP